MTRTSTSTGQSGGAVPFPTLELSDGWLCFQSEFEKRRLAPIPPEWEICNTARLEELCAQAGFATRATPAEDPPHQIQP